MRAFKRLAVSVGFAISLAVGLSSSAAAAPTPFGSDLATAPNFPFNSGFTVVNNAGGAGATPSGYVAPADGVITGWRVRAAGAGSPLLKFHVVRGNTNIYKGPAVNIGAADGVSATFPVFIAVQRDDRIGLTNDSGGFARQVAVNAPGAGYTQWNPPLGATETRAPLGTAPNISFTVQADLETGTCGGLRPTIIGTESADVLVGTSGDDVILANGGADLVLSLAGNDTICGGDGNDKLKGGPGRDSLFGDAGVDKLRGGGDRDVCTGGPQRDTAKKCERTRSL